MDPVDSVDPNDPLIELTSELFQLLCKLTKLKDSCEAAAASYATFIPKLTGKLLDWLVGRVWFQGLEKATRIKARILIDEEYRGKAEADLPSFEGVTDEELLRQFAKIYARDKRISRDFREQMLVFLMREYLEQNEADEEAVLRRGRSYQGLGQRALRIVLSRTAQESVSQSVESTVQLGAVSCFTPQASASPPFVPSMSSPARPPPTPSTRKTSASDSHVPSTPHGQAPTSSPPFPIISPFIFSANPVFTEPGSAGDQLPEDSQDSSVGTGAGVNLRGRDVRSLSPSPEDDEKRREVRKRD